MKNINQHMMNKKRQMLNHNQTFVNLHQQDGDGFGDSKGKTVYKDQWDFLENYGTLFRKSSLVLTVTLGRHYLTKFHVRDLSRSLDYDVSLISKNLKKMENFGLVKHEDVGNLVFYQANMNSVLLRHLKICFTLLELQDLIHGIEPVSTNSILYGSCAKGEDTSASDIDLFIETLDKDAVTAVLNNCQKKLTRTLSPVMVSPDETYNMKMNDKNFFSSIFEGIVLREGENVP